jgi:uncharacterized protein YdiU (UPF0061 family)
VLDADSDRAVERATASLHRFEDSYERHWLTGMRSKLGLFTEEAEDRALVNDLLAWMQRTSADFTNTFRALSTATAANAATSADPGFQTWRERLDARRLRQPQSPAQVLELMRRHNPAVVPRNHLVEEALEAATSEHDFSVMERLLAVLATPFDHDREAPKFSAPGQPGRPYRTVCGT